MTAQNYNKSNWLTHIFSWWNFKRQATKTIDEINSSCKIEHSKTFEGK